MTKNVLKRSRVINLLQASGGGGRSDARASSRDTGLLEDLDEAWGEGDRLILNVRCGR